jgi:SAM-dependent methyltransferase
LDDAVGDGLGGLAVAEINSCAQLHTRLRRLPRLAYSEYGSTDSTVPHQDLELLTYPSDSFDMVLTSDTLEHVPDVWTALQETKRVLAHGGAHVFTVPIVWSRKTVARAVRTPDGIDQRLPPSYHGPKGKCEPDRLVFNEFGSDFPALAAQHGLPLEVRTCPGNPLNAVFVLRKAVE